MRADNINFEVMAQKVRRNVLHRADDAVRGVVIDRRESATGQPQGLVGRICDGGAITEFECDRLDAEITFDTCAVFSLARRGYDAPSAFLQLPRSFMTDAAGAAGDQD